MPRGRPKNKPIESFRVVPVGKVSANIVKIPSPPPTPPPPPVVEEESEDVPENEADAMFERREKAEAEVLDKATAKVDAQDWTKNDPVIPEDLIGRVWVAVFKCPAGHKTKATNRQKDSGVLCYQCKMAGESVQAEIMPKLFENPPEDPNEADRKRRKKGK